MVRTLLIASLMFAFCNYGWAQCGPGGCPPARSYQMPQYAQPTYAYNQGGTGCNGGTSAMAIYYQSPPTFCPECQPQRQAAPLPPPPPQQGSDIVLASDGRYYPRSAWQQAYPPATQYAAAPIINAYVVESRSTVPVYAPAIPVYAVATVYAPANINIRERVVIRR